MKIEVQETRRLKKPWPTRDTMEQVYAMNLWGGDQQDFYSGEGSHQPSIVKPYTSAVTTFLTNFESPLIVCDLGCGDFNVGKQLVEHTQKYVAVDIVPKLIAHNISTFKEERLEFLCLDIAVDDLPSGDCALLRQVLQHLSNAEIHRILPKLIGFKYIILTEHLPVGDFVFNKDIISGQGTRLKKQSGLNILAPPFNFKVKEERQLAYVVSADAHGVIVTTLYTMF